MNRSALPQTLRAGGRSKAPGNSVVGEAGKLMSEPPVRPDPEWQRALDVLAPASDEMASFYLYWEPGSGHWDVVNRWMIANVIPPKKIPPFVRELLEGPNPRDAGYYDVVLRKFVSSAGPVSERQWLYYRLTGAYLAPYWVIQGTKGGHKLRWSHEEQTLAGINGRETALPLPGDLPYAEPDNRTWYALGQAARMAEFDYLLGTVDNAALLLDQEERAIAENMRKELWGWMEGQIEEVAPELEHAYRDDMSMAPDGDRDLPRKFEELKETFITGKAIE